MSRVDRLLLKPPEVAEALGLSRSRVYELLASGELPALRIGSSVRVSVEALRRWVDGSVDEPVKPRPEADHPRIDR